MCFGEGIVLELMNILRMGTNWIFQTPVFWKNSVFSINKNPNYDHAQYINFTGNKQC